MSSSEKKKAAVQPLSLEHCLLTGAFEQGLKWIEADTRSLWCRGTSVEWASGVTLLAFGGKLREARVHFEQNESLHSKGAVMEARYALAVGLVRCSDYSVARALFAQNLRQARMLSRGGRGSSETERAVFFAFQGVGFYHFFDSRFAASLRAAEKAFDCSLKVSFLLGQFLSRDLLGSVLIQQGAIKEGVKNLLEAERLAKRLNNQAFADASKISAAVARSQIEVESARAIQSLRKLLAQADPQDTYSRTYLLLEIARRLRISGDGRAAAHVLEEVSEQVYSFRNQRQVAELNFAAAHELLLKGQPSQALVVIRNSEQNLVPAVDRRLLIRIRGLGAEIARQVGREQLNQEMLTWGARYFDRYGNFVSRRIEARLRGTSLGFPRGQDPVGDLIDDLRAGDEEARERAIQAGCIGLLSHYSSYKIRWGERAFVVDIENDRAIVFDQGGVTLQTFRCTVNLRKLLETLGDPSHSEPFSKEHLVNAVWGYDYHPLRHDPLLHSALARLRRALGVSAHWLELHEKGYRLRVGLRVVFDPPLAGEKPSFVPKSRTSPRKGGEGVVVEALPAELNTRQLKCLQWLRKETRSAELVSINVSEYALRFSTTKVTSSRDLVDLATKGWVRAHGRARGTRYLTV